MKLNPVRLRTGKRNLSSDTQLSITVSKLENPQAIFFKFKGINGMEKNQQ